MNWQTLCADPLGFVHRQALLDCLGDGPEPLREHVLAQSRFRQRLLARLMQHYGLQPLAQLPTPEEGALAVLRLAPGAFARLPRLCGAIWHGATLAREVRGPVLQQLREQLGSGIYEQALAARALAGAADLLREPAALVAAIDQDGAACVSAWLHSQPDALRAWLLLRLPLPTDVPAQPAVHPGIVPVAAASLAEHEGPAP